MQDDKNPSSPDPSAESAPPQPVAPADTYPEAKDYGQPSSNLQPPELHHSRKKKWLLLSLFFLSIVAIAGASLYMYLPEQNNETPPVNSVAEQSSPAELKTVTYNNNKGSNFELKFYKEYEVKAAPGASSGIQELVSKKSVGGKAPLTLFIDQSNLDSHKTYDEIKNCNANMPLVMSSYNANVSQNINVCVLRSEGADGTYWAVFSDTKKNYLASFNQDLDWNKILSSREEAQSGLARAGLGPYNQDIKEILASIKPL